MTTTYPTDATTAAEITDALSTLGSVTLGPGTVLLTEPIIISGGCSLVGAGYTTRLHALGDFPCIDMSDAPSIPIGVNISGLRLTRQNTQAGVGSATESQGIVLWGRYVNVEDVWIEDCLTGVEFYEDPDEVFSHAVRLTHIPIINLEINEAFVGFDVKSCNATTMIGCGQVPGLFHRHITISNSSDVSDLQGEMELFLMTPDAADADVIKANIAGDSATLTYVPTGQPDIPRSITVTFAADWDGGDVSINGTDQFDALIFEVLESDPGEVAETSRTFKSVTLISKSAVGADAAEADIGTGTKIGIPKQLTIAQPEEMLLLVDGLEANMGTISRTYSYYTPQDAPDGTKVYRLLAPVLRA